MDDGSYSPCRTRLINKQEAKRDPSAVWLRKKLPGDFFRTVLCALFWFDGQANDAGADAEFSVVLQLGDAGALLFEIGPIGRVEITQADDLAFYFDRAMPAGNFGIVQNNVCVRPSDDHARFFHLVNVSFGRTRDYREDDARVGGERKTFILAFHQPAAAACSLRSRKGGKRGNGHGAIRFLDDLHDRWPAALRAAKLHAGVTGELRLIQDVFGSAMGAGSLHNLAI